MVDLLFGQWYRPSSEGIPVGGVGPNGQTRQGDDRGFVKLGEDATPPS
jgi:hypothetical protein